MQGLVLVVWRRDGETAKGRMPRDAWKHSASGFQTREDHPLHPIFWFVRHRKIRELLLFPFAPPTTGLKFYNEATPRAFTVSVSQNGKVGLVIDSCRDKWLQHPRGSGASSHDCILLMRRTASSCITMKKTLVIGE